MQLPHSLVLSDEMSSAGGTNSDSAVGGGGISGGGGEGGWDATHEPETETSPSPSSCGMAGNRVTTASTSLLPRRISGGSSGCRRGGAGRGWHSMWRTGVLTVYDILSFLHYTQTVIHHGKDNDRYGTRYNIGLLILSPWSDSSLRSRLSSMAAAYKAFQWFFKHSRAEQHLTNPEAD